MSAVVDEPLRAILDRARGAPSGDNEQPWHFEPRGADRVVVHGYDTRRACVYDLDGTSSWIGLGALLETIAIAASAEGRSTHVTRLPSTDEEPAFDVRLVRDGAAPDPLARVIETRSVQRRALSPRALTDEERATLAASVGPAFTIAWRDTAEARRRMAGLLYASARLRLVMPEAYAVHRAAIDWGKTFSDTGVPEAAVGLDPMTARLMRWVMGSWGRVRFFNTFLGGTITPRLQLDVLPALKCAAHFLLVAAHAPKTLDDFVAAGRAVQRLWLTAASLGLQLQPQVTPVIFARYDREARPFSALRGAAAMAGDIRRRMDREFGDDVAARAVFMGRVGEGRAATSRSLRRPLDELLVASAADARAQKERRSSR